MKNVAYRVTFPILDADGDLVTGATSPDSEISKDGGAFADCTNEATEIATSSGMYYLELTSTEMNADTVAIIVKSGNGKTTPIVLYPQEAADIKVAVTHWVATAVATPTTNGVPEVDITHIAGAAVSTSTAQLGVNTVQAGGTAWGSGAITAASIATDAIGASELAADAATEIGTAVWATAARTLTANTNLNDPTAAAVADAVWDEARAGHVAAGSFGEGVVVNNMAAGSVTAAAIATGAIDADAIADNAIDAGAIAADALTAAKFAADVTTELQNGLATAANLATLAGYVDTEVATILAAVDTEIGAIKAVTDTLTLGGIADALWDEVLEGSLTGRQLMRVFLAVLAGQSTGGGTSGIAFRDLADAKDRVAATIDGNRNRTAVTLDGS